MATELLQPGVEVIQQFRTVSPTIVSPTLVPCSVAPAFQILDAQVTNSAGSRVVNSEAVASVPAIIVSANPGPFAGLNGLTLQLSVNNGPMQEFTFADPTAAGLSVQQLIDQINSSLPAPTGFGAYTKTVGASKYLSLRSTTSGDGQYIKIGEGTGNTILGFAADYQVQGISSYRQEAFTIAPNNLPDPRNIIDELSVVNDSIRVFVNTGRALKEMKRDSTFLRGDLTAILIGSATVTFPLDVAGQTITIQDNPNGSNMTNTFGAHHTVVSYTTCSFTKVGSVVTVTDSTNPFTAKDLGRSVVIANATTGGNSGTFTVTAVATDGSSVSFSNASGAAEAFGATTTWTINQYGDISGLVASLNRLLGTTKFINAAGRLSYVTETGYLNVIAAPAGLNLGTGVVAAALMAVDDGSTGTTTPLVAASTGSFTASAGSATITGTVAVTSYSGTGKTLQFALNGGPMQEITVASTDDTSAKVATRINATMGAGFASINGSNYLVLTSSTDGIDSEIKIGAGTANADFGLTDNSVAYGQAFPPLPGDYLYAGGLFLGIIVQVAHGGVATRLKLDRKVSKAYYATSYYIEAMGIPSDLPVTRPLPDLIVDAAGNIEVKQEFLRDVQGTPIAGGKGQLIISYKALRLDVSQASANPALITLESTDALETLLSPVSADNPLALMLYFSLINAPGVESSGIGVDAISEANPDGTPESYSRALGFLEAQEVYALAPASQDPIVHQEFAAHVTAMSEPDACGERIAFINPKMPGEALPALVTSGTDGESTTVTNEFNTNTASLSADVLAAGGDPGQPQTVANGFYLVVSSSTKRYNISAFSGTKVTIRVAFSPGENDDGFYSTTNLSGSLLQESFTIYKRGVALVKSDGSPDYDAIALAYQKLGQSYGNRRVYMIAPESVAATINGAEQLIHGYYLGAAYAGMVGQLAPQQGFTNYPVTGFNRPVGSNDKFGRRQMNVGAAGGTFWVVQNTKGAPLMARHQLSTDLTSVETRELSITKIVDFVAKMMRGGLRNFIGKFNITQPFLDTLSTVIQGQLSFLVEQGVLIGGDLNNIVQDAHNPDTVLIDVTLDVPYPCNYLRLTLVI